MHKIFQLIGYLPNKSLHLTAIPLRSIAAGELGRYSAKINMNCPLSKIEKRLSDCINLWRKANESYFSPDEFRININSCIQNLRSVTFILQKEKSKFSNFEQWYSKWQDKMKNDPTLKWLVDARNRIVKEGDLETKSYAEIAIIEDWFEPPVAKLELSPFLSNEELADSFLNTVSQKQIKKCSILRISRQWIDSTYPEQEILELLAHSIETFISLLVNAHSDLITDDFECTKLAEYLSYVNGRPSDLISSDWERILWMDLNTKQTLTPASINFEKDEDLMEEAKNHYKLTDNFEDLRSSKNVIDEAKALYKQAKVILEKDGYHTTIAILTLPSGSKELISLVMENRTDKYLMFRNLAQTVKKLNAEAIVFLGEIWLSKYDDKFPDRVAEDDVNKQEALVAIGIDMQGNHITCTAPFTKEDGKIIFGKDYFSKIDIMNFTLPIKEVWSGN